MYVFAVLFINQVLAQCYVLLYYMPCLMGHKGQSKHGSQEKKWAVCGGPRDSTRMHELTPDLPIIQCPVFQAILKYIRSLCLFLFLVPLFLVLLGSTRIWMSCFSDCRHMVQLAPIAHKKGKSNRGITSVQQHIYFGS